ncbi:MAG: hypothetical protein B6U78_02145 [Candidatus Aenigmarchaeota archaeon ex4484_224]|nr:MAG: hypothetical protein B6U78_02145 [Candidatus Aenigmarchaeota archaeon ex4484_224]
MKGQSFFEHYFTLSLFIVAVGILFLQIVKIVPFYQAKMKSQILNSKAFQISEILVNDYGCPADWNLDNVERIGLNNQNKNQTNFISIEKIQKLNQSCQNNGYQFVKEKIGLEKEYEMKILIKFLNGSLLVNCSLPKIEKNFAKEKIERIAYTSQGYVKICVEVMG